MEDTNMNKEYINPEMVIVKIATQQMLAASGLGISGETNDTNDLLSRDYDDWDED